jgi:ATP/maltotriose-dependent transcriptional regulator MalT
MRMENGLLAVNQPPRCGVIHMPMHTPLVSTRLVIPLPHPNRAARRRLLEQPDERLQCALTIISAPAGFGKTTVAAEWLNTKLENRAAWTSPEDNEVGQWLACVIAALSRLHGPVCEATLNVLQETEVPPPKVIQDAVLYDLADIGTPIVLVLDLNQPQAKNQQSHLVDPLSERELEVLRLIATGQSPREIAKELVITIGTVRNHLKNIYAKLNVHNRVQAIARARIKSAGGVRREENLRLPARADPGPREPACRLLRGEE